LLITISWKVSPTTTITASVYSSGIGALFLYTDNLPAA